MAQTTDDAPTGADKLRRIERIIAAYPTVEPADLEFLLNWYRNEASAYDVAMLAANRDIHDGYTRFRSDHIDRLTSVDAVKALVWIAVSAAIVLAIYLIAR